MPYFVLLMMRCGGGILFFFSLSEFCRLSSLRVFACAFIARGVHPAAADWFENRAWSRVSAEPFAPPTTRAAAARSLPTQPSLNPPAACDPFFFLVSPSPLSWIYPRPDLFNPIVPMPPLYVRRPSYQ